MWRDVVVDNRSYNSLTELFIDFQKLTPEGHQLLYHYGTPIEGWISQVFETQLEFIHAPGVMGSGDDEPEMINLEAIDLSELYYFQNGKTYHLIPTFPQGRVR